MSALRRIAASPHLAVLAGVLVLGGVLRFTTLDLQSYRYDEAVTVGRVLQPSLFDDFARRPAQRVDAAALLPRCLALVAPVRYRRSLDALALGTWREPPRSPSSTWRRWHCRCRGGLGLIAAAMVAVSPVLIWFSQDARAYALVFLLTSSPSSSSPAPGAVAAAATSPGGRPSRRWRWRPTTSPAS